MIPVKTDEACEGALEENGRHSVAFASQATGTTEGANSAPLAFLARTAEQSRAPVKTTNPSGSDRLNDNERPK